MGRAYSCWVLNCWCITWPVGFKRLIWFGFLTIIHCVSKCVGMFSVTWCKYLRSNIVHFVDWLLRIRLILIDLTSLRIPGVNRTWFLHCLHRPIGQIALRRFGNGTNSRNLVMFYEYRHSQCYSTFMFAKIRRKSKLGHIWNNYKCGEMHTQ